MRIIIPFPLWWSLGNELPIGRDPKDKMQTRPTLHPSSILKIFNYSVLSLTGRRCPLSHYGLTSAQPNFQSQTKSIQKIKSKKTLFLCECDERQMRLPYRWHVRFLNLSQSQVTSRYIVSCHAILTFPELLWIQFYNRNQQKFKTKKVHELLLQTESFKSLKYNI